MIRRDAEDSLEPAPPALIDDGSVTTLLRELMPELLRYFGRRVPTPDDAADCLGDTLLVLWRQREAVPRDRETARRYAFGVAANVLRESLRGRARRLALRDRARAFYEAPRQYEGGRDADEELWRALGELRDIDRELILLVAWEGFGVAEAGAILGLSDQASRARYSRARRRLRSALSTSRDD